MWWSKRPRPCKTGLLRPCDWSVSRALLEQLIEGKRPPGAPPLRREAAKKEEEKTSDPPYQPRQKPLGSLSLRNLGAGGAKVAPIAAHLVGSAHGAPSGAKLHAVTSL